jgi:hypothetical protein
MANNLPPGNRMAYLFWGTLEPDGPTNQATGARPGTRPLPRALINGVIWGSQNPAGGMMAYSLWSDELRWEKQTVKIDALTPEPPRRGLASIISRGFFAPTARAKIPAEWHPTPPTLWVAGEQEASAIDAQKPYIRQPIHPNSRSVRQATKVLALVTQVRSESAAYLQYQRGLDMLLNGLVVAATSVLNDDGTQTSSLQSQFDQALARVMARANEIVSQPGEVADNVQKSRDLVAHLKEINAEK